MQRKFIYTIVFLLTLAVIPVFAQEATYIDTTLDSLDNKGEMMVYVNVIAEQYNVSPKLMKCLIRHENRNWIPELQSGIVTNGVREKSWGLSQIHLPSHPSISLEEATDPKFSIEFMAQEIANKRAWQWSTLKYCKQYQ